MHKILVVDDEPDICEVLKQGFETGGNYRVSCASTRREAIAALHGERLDLALLDILMRENAEQEIEALAAQRGVPVLRMTGHPDIVQTFEQQGIPILAKPFRIGDLIAKVDRLLAEAQQLHHVTAEHIRAAHRLVGRTASDMAPGLAIEEMSAQWVRLCRRVLKVEDGRH